LRILVITVYLRALEFVPLKPEIIGIVTRPHETGNAIDNWENVSLIIGVFIIALVKRGACERVDQLDHFSSVSAGGEWYYAKLMITQFVVVIGVGLQYVFCRISNLRTIVACPIRR